MSSIPDDHPIHKWIDSHLAVTDEYHAFSLFGPPALDPQNVELWELNTDIPIGPAILKLRGTINFQNGTCDFTVSIKVPIFPEVKLGSIKGNLNDGITLKIGSSKLISGLLTLHLIPYNGKKWLAIDIDVNILGKHYTKKDVRIVPLPFV
uniref:Uncharacterized protein n=1 Tax=Psilocybe cubensis TaxID=181762 RepID=A0A8H7XMR3_PSICU